MRYRFGEVELDLSSYTLERSGQKVHLTPKVFDLLRHLIDHRDRVVTKDELLDAVWSGSAVNEGAVPWAINQARAALGQSGGAKRPIETVYGRGYRFVAEVEIVDSPRASSGTPSVPPPLAARAASSAPFVGRAQAMARLLARLAAAKSGSGGVCTLVGPAGIGKTRCMEELAVRARAEGFAVWSGRSTEDSVAPAFWPWTRILSALQRDRPALREGARSALAHLEAGVGERTQRASEPPGATPAASFAFFESMSGLLRDATSEGPLLLSFDDLHWADVSSVNLLSFLAPELAHQAVLVVTAQREGRKAQTRELRRLWRHAELIELPPLEPADIDQYLSAITGERARHVELSEALHRATAGNPLFLSQTLRALIAQHGAEGLGSLAPDLVKPFESAHDILRSALDALDQRARRLLQVGSVLGEEIEVSALATISETDTETLLSALDAASREGFLIAHPPNRFRFRHALLRSALYDELPAAQRARAHRRAAEALERTAAAAQRTGEIAHHYHRSLALGDVARVAASAEQAAQAAERVQAFADAATFYRWAYEARGLEEGASPRPRAKLLLRRAQMQGLSGRVEEAQQTIAELDAIARRHGYWDLLVRAARVLRPTHLLGVNADPRACAMLEEALRSAPESEKRVHISALSRLSWTPPYALDMQRSKELSSRALELARELDDDDALLEAMHAQLYALSGPDDIDALLQVAAEMQRRDRTKPTWVTAEALIASYGALLYRGDLAAADAVLATQNRIAREHKWPEASWGNARMLAQRRLLEGDFAAAEAAFTELRSRAQRMGLGYGIRLTDMMLAMLATKREGPAAFAFGETARFFASIHDVMPSMRPALALLGLGAGLRAPAQSVLQTMLGPHGSELPREIGYLNALASLASIAVELADEKRAAMLYEELSPYPHHNTPTCILSYEGSASHFLALLAAFSKRDERARAHFDDAQAMNEKLGVLPQLACTYYEHARFELATARSPARKAAARELRQRSVDLAQGLRMRWLGERARALA